MIDQASIDMLNDRARSGPHDLLAEGDAMVTQYRSASDNRSASVWLRAMGLAARSAVTLTDSVRLLEESVDEASHAEDRVLEAEARLSLSGSLAMLGDNGSAVLQLALAAALVEPDQKLLGARIDFQRGTILARQAMPSEAMPFLISALHVYRDVGDVARVAPTLKNLGNLHMYAGDHSAAEAAYEEARDGYNALERPLDVAGVEYNLGQLALVQGDIPRALERFDRSEETRRRLLGSDFEPHVGKAEALLAGGLFTEAVALAKRWRGELHDRDQGADEAEAALLLAQASLLAGDLETARAAGEDAVSLTIAQERTGWTARARFVLLEAGVLGGERSTGTIDEAEGLARQLDEAGQFVPAAACWLTAGRLALENGALERASRAFERLQPYRHRGPIELRVQAWLAAALERDAVGDGRGADAAARAGARTVSEYQSALGATDVRVGVAQYASELNELGMKLALRSKRPRRVWEWMERTRAGAARVRAVVPEMDADLQRDVAALRQTTSELRDADQQSVAVLTKRRTALQESIRSRTRVLARDASAASDRSLFADVRDALQEVPLIEMAVVDGELWAVVVGKRSTLHKLGSFAEIEFELASMRATLRRVAGRGLDDVAERTIRHVAEQLGGLLLPPGFAAETAVIVPPARLHAVPWSLLPQLADTALSVAPSAEQWLAARRGSASGSGVVVAAGPGLAEADAEVDDLVALYPDAAVFTSNDSDVASVLEKLDGARLAHIACHGTFQYESPMFSALQLAAGDLVTYDIERLEAAPSVVVLSSCDAGLSAARPGDELMGLTSALLTAGTSSLIASIGLVPDTPATRAFMSELHRRMRDGLPPARALADARRDVAADAHAALAAASFVCFGS